MPPFVFGFPPPFFFFPFFDFAPVRDRECQFHEENIQILSGPDLEG
jgi:hypothetical protein